PPPPPIPTPHRKQNSRGPKRVASPPPVEQLPATTPSRKIFTPVTGIALAIVLTVSVTGVLVWRTARYEWARSSIRPAIDRGLQALHERDFSTASKAFSDATRALDVLGRHDAADQAVRQYQREADAAAQLSVDGAQELLQRVAAGNQRADLPTRFKEEISGKWMLFDAVLDREADSEGAERWLVDVPLWLDEQPVQIVFEEMPWPSFWRAGGENSRRVVF